MNALKTLVAKSFVAKSLMVATTLTLPVLALAADRFTEADFKFDVTTNLHKQTIIAGVNYLAATDPRCQDIDPLSVHLDYANVSPDDMGFVVTCGKDAAATEVTFTQSDAEKALREAAVKK
ncbi:MAG: hypothetical protein LBF16_07750 [Pseudomonadales bacterium]|jgi:hypothetical protein|nr:hypothetical protein [Pseudomonadales bacterium]